jgi:hypothetical protein
VDQETEPGSLAGARDPANNAIFQRQERQLQLIEFAANAEQR